MWKNSTIKQMFTPVYITRIARMVPLLVPEAVSSKRLYGDSGTRPGALTWRGCYWCRKPAGKTASGVAPLVPARPLALPTHLARLCSRLFTGRSTPQVYIMSIVGNRYLTKKCTESAGDHHPPICFQ